jgi:hypothetical protein
VANLTDSGGEVLLADKMNPWSGTPGVLGFHP